jgi:hypothetical protein
MRFSSDEVRDPLLSTEDAVSSGVLAPGKWLSEDLSDFIVPYLNLKDVEL